MIKLYYIKFTNILNDFWKIPFLIVKTNVAIADFFRNVCDVQQDFYMGFPIVMATKLWKKFIGILEKQNIFEDLPICLFAEPYVNILL